MDWALHKYFIITIIIIIIIIIIIQLADFLSETLGNCYKKADQPGYLLSKILYLNTMRVKALHA